MHVTILLHSSKTHCLGIMNLEDPETLNTTLKLSSDIERYIGLCKDANFVHRSDAPKNWDNYKALKFVLKNHPDRNAVIMDAGGIPASAFLPSLQHLGYKRLVALDLSNPEPARFNGDITYRRGDITQTAYPANYFDAVGCLSVIEHGVDVNKFFAEMGRVLKSGGSLIVSTDYWQDKIENTDGRSAYGVPVHIFSQQEIEKAIVIAEKHGFKLSSDTIDFDVDEKTISWMGFQYTFIVLAFTKI